MEARAGDLGVRVLRPRRIRSSGPPPSRIVVKEGLEQAAVELDEREATFCTGIVDRTDRNGGPYRHFDIATPITPVPVGSVVLSGEPKAVVSHSHSRFPSRIEIAIVG